MLDHPGATVEEVCERFEMTRETLIADLELLYVTGVRYGPGDLMEAWVDGDKVRIGFADYFARAPRLTWREAAGLYLAGQALDALRVAEQGRWPGPGQAGGGPARRPARPGLAGRGGSRSTWRATRPRPPHGAGQGGRHRPPGRDRVLVVVPGELTHRKVDPWVVFSASGHWYLSGWCHKAVAERLFRVDRVVSVRPTEEPFERPAGFDPDAHGELGGTELFAGGLECELDLAPEAEWAADYFPIWARTPPRRAPAGRLATHQLSWLVRLVLRLAPAAEPVSPRSCAGPSPTPPARPGRVRDLVGSQR